MPLVAEVESVVSEKVNIPACPKEVTGNYLVANWSKFQNNWPHLSDCSFSIPAKDGLVDILIGVDNPELHILRWIPKMIMVARLPVWVHLNGPVLVLQKSKLDLCLDLTQFGLY